MLVFRIMCAIKLSCAIRSVDTNTDISFNAHSHYVPIRAFAWTGNINHKCTSESAVPLPALVRHWLTNTLAFGKLEWRVLCVTIFCKHNFVLGRLPNVNATRRFVPWTASETSHNMRSVLIWHLIWQITCNYNRLDGGYCDGTGHRKIAVLGMAGDHGDNPWNFY